MGKLNIAHHKSYHPYRQDNIERVRRDEEEARKLEEREEGRMLLADSEARLDVLRERAGVNKKKKGGRDDDMKELDRLLSGKGKEKERERATIEDAAGPGSSASAAATTAVMGLSQDGHINLFAELEQTSIAASIAKTKAEHAAADAKKKPRFGPPRDERETEKGFPLAPTKEDLNPWYNSKGAQPEGDEQQKEAYEERQNRERERKEMHDPLTSINRQLAGPSPLAGPSSRSYRSRPSAPVPTPSATLATTPSTTSFSQQQPKSTLEARLTRESSERQRALALIARRKREAAASTTPSTAYGGGDADMMGNAYADVFNRREVEEAHRHREERERGGDRGGGWGRDRDGGRGGGERRASSVGVGWGDRDRGGSRDRGRGDLEGRGWGGDIRARTKW